MSFYGVSGIMLRTGNVQQNKLTYFVPSWILESSIEKKGKLSQAHWYIISALKGDLI